MGRDPLSTHPSYVFGFQPRLVWAPARGAPRFNRPPAKGGNVILDNFESANRYRALGPDFAMVLDRLRDRSASWPIGQTDFRPDNVWLSVVQKAGRPALNSGFEYHRNFADLHFCLSGAEQIGWRENADGLSVRAAFNPDKDFGLFEGTPTQLATLSGSRFALFFPGELHAPLIGEGELTKICVKIRMSTSA